MNWEKSKTIIICLLVALNVYLFSISSIFETNYQIKGEKEKSIIELLNKNGIGVYDEINIDFEPLSPLNILASEEDIDKDNYLKAFFEEPEVVSEDGKLIGTEDSKTIIFENGFLAFTVEDENEYVSYGESLEKFIKSLDVSYMNFVLDKTFTDPISGYITYEFREKYKDKIVYTNYLSIKTKDDKIAEITGFYGEIEGVTDKAREIASIDMVLYTFMEESKIIYEDKQIFITDVDLVYYQEEYITDGVTKAIPCYRIYCEGEEVPFIISAYENKVVN